MENYKYCEGCGKQVLKTDAACPHCGKNFSHAPPQPTKFCQHCGSSIDKECIVCPRCGKQVAELKSEQPQVIINNSSSANSTAANVTTGRGEREINKWVAFVLCFFLGYLGFHKFYEGKIGMGILYLCTFGLFGIGWFIDAIAILLKPNPYYI